MGKTFLLDSSAWIEYLKGTGSDTHLFVRELRDARSDIATTEPVMAELLMGTKGEKQFLLVEQMLNEHTLLSVEPHLDFRDSAVIYREARSKGKTIRKAYDCLIAAVALRTDAVLVHSDRDFDHLAEVVPKLRTQRHNRC
ncbi:hypothetical protein HDA32_005070 [Spinactinospora alkalitolerans]|uniref:Ribonuclease VapC n=1 Tax=Spinactinospora alkalitolerans TaxID=687207 RepID=A0A852U7Q0_9ACTN|nr:PIN domain nuclease [Spinactinospora alkalitolerans]NYE49950.1 hypothetical protein [Spinactinospora alkalitolerans]